MQKGINYDTGFLPGGFASYPWTWTPGRCSTSSPTAPNAPRR